METGHVLFITPKSDAWGWQLQRQCRIIFLFKIMLWIVNEQALFVAKPRQQGCKLIWSINYVTQRAHSDTPSYQKPLTLNLESQGNVCVCSCAHIYKVGGLRKKQNNKLGENVWWNQNWEVNCIHLHPFTQKQKQNLLKLNQNPLSVGSTGSYT